MDTFESLDLPDTVLLVVEQLNAGPHAQPVGTIAVPICRVRAIFAPDNVFEVWLPTSSWNGKYQGEGNGGLAGSITFSDMRTAIARGYASSSTDTGHQSNAAGDPWWTNAQQIKDYGYNSIHQTALLSKTIIDGYYGSEPAHSYFVACSTGGREAFMEAQRYPDDYDGIIAGSPVYRVLALRSRHVWTWQCNHLDPSEAHAIPNSKLRPIFDAVIAACDHLDGLVDGQVDDTRRCGFDPASVQCAGADDGHCLTAAQVETLKCMYAGPINQNDGTQLYPGVPMTSELDEGQSIGIVPNPQYTTFFANTVFEDPNYDFKTFDFGADYTYTLNKEFGGETLELIHNATSTDLSAFEGRGGKFIIWHGWADPLPQAIDTIAYYKRVKKFFEKNGHGKDKPKVEDFARLFLLPNVGHCGGGAAGGPNTFDAVTSLEQWVEGGVAPDKIIASRVSGNVVTRTRPICAYPNRARYTGTGSIDDAASFVCKPGGWEDDENGGD